MYCQSKKILEQSSKLKSIAEEVEVWGIRHLLLSYPAIIRKGTSCYMETAQHIDKSIFHM